MVIEESDFRMTKALGTFWDLELLYTVKPKGKPERQEFKDAGYGMTLEHCMKKVIYHRMGQKKESYTLKEFIQDYKREVDRLEELLSTKMESYGSSEEKSKEA